MSKVLVITVGTGKAGKDIAHAINFSIEQQNPDIVYLLLTKTSRIVFEDGEPKYLTGWIKVPLNKTIDKMRKQIDSFSNKENIDPLETLKQKFKVTESKKK